MRYPYFLSGLRNRESKAALITSMMNSIPQAVAVLLYKNMIIPVEGEADFVSDSTPKAPTESALFSQMLQMLRQNQDLILQQ
jgi:hypothetical protein